MEIYLQDTIELESGNRKQIFTTNSNKIKEISFEYLGTENHLDSFLKTTIHSYLQNINC